MANVFDYLNWRDDLSFDSLNEIDVLIFNRIVYFPWERIVNEQEKISISDAYQKALTNKEIKCAKQDLELLKRLAHSKRYQELKISSVVCKVDLSKEEQFMALTIHLPKNYLYIAFRGTTNDIIGWKESLNMSYMTIFSQLDALNYLKKVNISKKLYLGGHSKGGNLAMYAAIHANRLIQKRIVKVYNYDGPGFLELNDKYYSINKKIISYLPSSSIIGRLMNTNHETKIITSNKTGFNCHNLYTWQVEKDYFIESTFTEESNFLKKITDEFLKRVSPNNRQKFVNDVFDAILKTGAKSIKDINFSKLKDIILSYRALDKESKELLFSIFKVVYDSTKDNMKISNQ